MDAAHVCRDPIGELEGAGFGETKGIEPQKVCKPHAKDGERKPGDVLIGHKGDCQDGIDEGRKHAGGKSGKQRDREAVAVITGQKPAQAPIDIMPSTPRFRWPTFSETISPTVPKRSASRRAPPRPEI